MGSAGAEGGLLSQSSSLLLMTEGTAPSGGAKGICL